MYGTYKFLKSKIFDHFFIVKGTLQGKKEVLVLDASLGATGVDYKEVPARTAVEMSSANVTCHTPGKLGMDAQK